MNRRLVMVLVFAAMVGIIASFFVYQVVRQVAMSGGPEGPSRWWWPPST
jgi:hypothetical protein